MRDMNLKTYIKKHGHESLAARWGFSPRRVQSWLYGQRIPSPAAANKVVALTGGEVSLAGIYANND